MLYIIYSIIIYLCNISFWWLVVVVVVASHQNMLFGANTRKMFFGVRTPRQSSAQPYRGAPHIAQLQL